MKLSELKILIQNLPHDNTAGQRQQFDYLRELGFDPGTLYQELEMESRYVDTHQDTSYSNSSVNLHSHAFYELLYCCNTCGAEYLVGAERYRLQKGDILLVPPGVSHRPMLPEQLPEPYKRYVIWVSTEFISWLMQLFSREELLKITDRRLIRTAGTKWEYLGDVFRRGVLEAEKKDMDWEAAVVANTAQLIVQLRRATVENSAKSLKAERPQLLDQVMAYIEENLSKKITLSDTAAHFYVSESTITQLFRKKMDVSFYRFVTQRRLIAAKELIARGQLLETVSQDTGFSDYSAFYRAFRQEYGISPRQYRKLQQQSPQG